MLLAGCSDGSTVIQADDIELIHVDMRAQRINVTVTADGTRTTIALTPRAAVELQAEMARAFALTIESAEALQGQTTKAGPPP